jgi:ketosteroid isomerase-like protein
MTNTDESRIREIVENWAKAVRAQDINGVLAHHSANILLFDLPEPVQAKGIDAYRLSWEELFFPWYGEDGSFDVSELNITTGNDVAFCHGIINCSGTENGKKVNPTVRLTIGLKKINGEWTVVHEHHSEAVKL